MISRNLWGNSLKNPWKLSLLNSWRIFWKNIRVNAGDVLEEFLEKSRRGFREFLEDSLESILLDTLEESMRKFPKHSVIL